MAPRPTDPSGAEIRQTGDLEWAKSDLSISPELEPRKGEEELTEEEAVKILAGRFQLGQRNVSNIEKVGAALDPRFWGDHGIPDSDRAGHDLMLRIVRALPPKYRTSSVLTYIDLRPLLEELAITEEQRDRAAATLHIGGQPFTPDERLRAAELLVEETGRIEEIAVALAANEETAGRITTTAQRDQYVATIVNSYKNGGELGTTPQLAVDAGDTDQTLDQREAAQGQLTQTTLYNQLVQEADVLGGEPNAYSFLSENEMQFMFRMNMVDWNQILETERNKVDARRAGQGSVPSDFMVDTGGLIPGQHPAARALQVPQNLPSEDRKAFLDQIGGSGNRTRVRLLDVFNSLYSPNRTNKELRNLQDKLIAAGYLDEENVRYWGRSTDDATVEAWRTLIRDSINTGTNMAELLKDQTIAKREKDAERDRKSMRDIVLSSRVGVAQSADTLAQQVLGRKLRPADHAKIVEFIHGLERRSANVLAPEGAQEAEEVDVAAEIEAYIERENATEAGAYDLLEQFNQFQNTARQRG